MILVMAQETVMTTMTNQMLWSTRNFWNGMENGYATTFGARCGWYDRAKWHQWRRMTMHLNLIWYGIYRNLQVGFYFIPFWYCFYVRQMTEMDGDWCEERPTLIDSYGWALNPECFYLNLPILILIITEKCLLCFTRHDGNKYRKRVSRDISGSQYRGTVYQTQVQQLNWTRKGHWK